ncbi:MAG: class I SAM-dependent methyltransferase [Acidimicrobiales bacterium]
MAAGDRDRWNRKWASAGVGTTHGSRLAELLAPWLPPSGTLLEIAGGAGSDSIEFARRGLQVTVADISDIALAQARELAGTEGLELDTLEIDFEEQPPPDGPWQVITAANYLQRDLFPAMIQRLAPGGLLGVVIATTTNLERHERPGAPFLLEPGELPGLVDGTTILHHSEEWRGNGRHEAHLVVRA